MQPPTGCPATTSGGADFTVSASEVTLEGEAWIDVREIALDDASLPLEIYWLDDLTWQVFVPLEEGDNALSLVATDLHGKVVGTDAVLVTSD